MKIRLISDLHIDINSAYKLDFKAEKLNDMFTLVAGDICGNPEHAAKWMKDNIRQGAFVSGNHDVYDTDMPIEDVKSYFAKEFPLASDVTYFDNDAGVIAKDIGKNVMLVADVMYTDYKYPESLCNPDGDVHHNMMLADPWRNRRNGMNDFNYGRCKKIWPGLNDGTYAEKGRLVPEWCLEHHEKAFKAITDAIESNASKDVILMTHHCLSPKCIDDEHDGCSVIASYVSDKEDWVKAHPNIKCICSGHIHARKMFHVGDALYVMNSLGYCRNHYMQWSSTAKVYEPWTPDCIIDTETWTAEFKPHEMHGWKETYDKHVERMKQAAAWFM